MSAHDPTAWNVSPVKLTRKDYVSDQDVRWCPGCGDYAILAQVQKVFADLQIDRDRTVFVSGIGCSSRFPYYMNTYGLHSIHGRAPAIASGLKIARPDLDVWVVTGDGDGLSIGGNHFIHVMRRNVNLKVLLFNNRIYGLTKGQYSPTSELGKRTPSTPLGSTDPPINPASVALGCGATFVARTIDTEIEHLQQVIRRVASHQGTAFVEIYQNCNVFNDGAFETFTEKATKPMHSLFVEQGKPLTFANGTKGICIKEMKPRVIDIGPDFSPNDCWIHDERDNFKASILVRLFGDPRQESAFPRPFGVFYVNDRATHEDKLGAQVKLAKEKKGLGDLDALLKGEHTWTIS